MRPLRSRSGGQDHDVSATDENGRDDLAGRVRVVTALIDLGEPGDALEALAEVEPDEPG